MSLVVDRLQEMIAQGAAPGFQCALGFRDKNVGLYSVGRKSVEGGRVGERTLFDLASLTKVVSTITLLMAAVQQKKCDLKDPLSKYFASFASPLKEKTLKDLVLHRAGLAPTFETLRDFSSREERLRFLVQQVDETYQALDPQYSDVGYMLLGVVLEQVFGERLREVFGRFGFHRDLLYGPVSPRRFWIGRRVASLQSLEDSEEILCGRVQDPRADWLEGDAGHAGLFGSAKAVDGWAQQIFGAYHGKDTVFGDRVVRDFMNFDEDPRWVGGFDRPTQPSQAGELFPRSTVGHLGYSGASFWMDLESGARVTLLAHRFSPGYDPEVLRKLRPEFHNWLWREVFFKL